MNIGKMQRYIEMGFSAELSAEAVERFEDDLHSGCHWLMTRESVGRVPKRLCLAQHHSNETYYDSEVTVDGVKWKVDGYDKKHALIRIRNHEKARWKHISDARLEWVVVHHNKPQNFVPKASWKRKVGSFTMAVPVLSGQYPITVQNAISTIQLHGRPSANRPIDQGLWRALFALNRTYKHVPSRPKPQGTNSRDIHEFRVEWMTYFFALCDVYNVTEQCFSTTLYEEGIEAVLKLFPASDELRSRLEHWSTPQSFLKKELQEWKQDCLPLVEFTCSKIVKECVYIDVHFHDMTFVKLDDADEARIHLQFQYLFAAIFDTDCVVEKGYLDRLQLQKTLKKSKKSHNDSTEPSDIFVTTLFPYQKQTLNWLQNRETIAPHIDTEGWRRHELSDGFTFHSSVFGHFSHTAPTQSVRGGILAQDVGMGKTVEMLALIATSPVPGPTLVVMPTTMLSVWMVEAQKHVPSLKTVKFHGARRSLLSIKEADIVCTTYRIVANESRNHVPTLGAIRWGRIILDESHELQNMQSVTAAAVCNLHAPVKWCVSATPWNKQSHNVFAMMALFNLYPFLQYMQSATVQSPLHLDVFSVHHLCKILSKITWWQQQRHVRLNLPPVNTQIVTVDNVQQLSYAHLVNAIRVRMSTETTYSRRTHVMYYTWLLKMAAFDISLVPLSAFGTISTTNMHDSESKSIESFVSTLGNSMYDHSVRALVDSWSQGQLMCSICMDVIERPTLTPCHHLFCFDCIQSSYHHDEQHKCPLCRKLAGTECLKELTMGDVEETVDDTIYTTDLHGKRVQISILQKEEIVQDGRKQSSKMDALLQLIQQNGKTVVFTLYHLSCTAVCTELSRQNIPFVSIQGRMSPKQRQNAIESFQHNLNVQVFVMTLKTAAVGITLTAANYVVFLEQVPSPAMRKQAIGRVWRIGQTEEVHVSTLMTNNTIDTMTLQQLLDSSE
jgi:superfamily II DNA or RNA helicase